MEFDEKAKELKLTPKQVIFCHEYVVDWNASRSARVAGYSENTVGEIGYENLRKPQIKEYIDFIQKDLAKLANVSALRNVQELSKIAYSSIAHLHNSWIELKEFESLTDDQKSAIESIDTKTEVVNMGEETLTVKYVKIKLYSKTQALDMINKMLGWNAPTKQDITSLGEKLSSTVNVEIVRPQDEDEY